MPCNSDYMNQTDREKGLQGAAKLYMYVLEETGQYVPDWVAEAAQNQYCTEDRQVALLCQAIQNFSQEQLNRIMYDGRVKRARQLAIWWEEHQAADAVRIRQESIDEMRKRWKAQVLDDITDLGFEAWIARQS